MTFKSTEPPKYNIDMSQDKYDSRYDRLMNILYYAKELPTDLYTQMNLTHDNYRKAISILNQRGLIKKITKDGTIGHVLSLKAKQNTSYILEYMKYRDCVDDISDRHQDIKRRSRKRQFAYLYALFDRVGIPYETFDKPPISNKSIRDNKVCFYTALDLKRMLDIEATTFIGSRLMGFLIGKRKIISVYRVNRQFKTLGRHEALIPELLMRYFTGKINTAVMICSDDEAAVDITDQIIHHESDDPRFGVNTAHYKCFYVFPSDDSFLSHFEDLYADYTAKEQRLIEQYGIDTSDQDRYGRYRYKSGTGFLENHPVLVCAGNVNVVKLKYFVRHTVSNNKESCIICNRRDAETLKALTECTPVTVITV